LISVDFDASFMEMTDEISDYLSAVDDVLNYYNENGQVKYVSNQAVRSTVSLLHSSPWLCLSTSL